MNTLVFRALSFILTVGLGGFSFYLYSRYYTHLPKMRLKKVEIFPSIRIHVSGKIIHLHHWFNFLIILTITIFLNDGFLTSMFFKGFCAGGLIQGVFLPGKQIGRRLIFKEDLR